MDKGKLLAKRLPQDDVEIDGVGTITVRGLSRHEVMTLKAESDRKKIDFKTVLWALVEPKLTEAEMKQWLRNAPAGEFEAVVSKVLVLSGIGEDEEGEAYKSAGEESG